MRKSILLSIVAIIITALISFCTKVDFDDLPTGPVDTDVPVITIDGNDTISMQVNTSFIMPEVTAYDSTDGDITDSIIEEGSVDTSDTGSNFIYFEVSDKAGNIGYCTLTVFVVNTAPILELTPPDTVKLAPETIFSEPGYTAKSPDGSIDLKLLVEITYYDESDSIVDSASIGTVIGNYKILYKVEYGGVSKTAWRYVEVTNDDFTPPVITILGKNPDTLWTWQQFIDSSAIAIDNVDDSVPVTTVDSVILGTEGIYKVYYSAEDSAGNKADTFRTVVIIKDTTIPVFEITEDSIVIELNDSMPNLSIKVDDTVDGDLSGKVIINGTVDSSKAGIYILAVSVSDTTGNSATDTITVYVFNPPVIYLNGVNPDSILLGATQYNDPGAYVTDNINDTIPVILGIGNINTDTEGEYSLVYKYTDNDGNVADSVVRTVVVKAGVDSIAPVITVLDPTTDTIWVGESHKDSGATAVDNKDGQIDLLIITSDDIDSTKAGIYTITYIVSDLAGNSDTATKSVVVIADTIAPVITITGTNPATINIGDAIPTVTVAAIDNKDGDLTDSISDSGTVNNNVPGTYKIIYTVSDLAGNTSTDTFTVNVGDNVAPVINIVTPNPDTVEYGASFNDSVTATDNIDGDLTDSITTTGTINTSSLGTQYLYYEVTDAAGNSAYDTLTVLVVDLTAPVLTISGANPVSISLGDSWSNPSATALDNVDGDLTDSIKTSGTVNSALEGNYNVIYSVSDLSGNTSKDTLVVNVTSSPDTVNPVITISGNNPDTVAYGSSYSEPTVTATDNVDGDLTSSIVKVGTISTSTMGTQTAIYTVTDAAGNDTSVTLTVEVMDLTAPVLVISGTNPDTIQHGASYSEPAATATDDVDGNITANITKTGSINSSTLGAQTVIYSISDAAGNESKDTLNVLVVDTVSPVIAISGSNPDTVDYGSTFTEPTVTASDNADGDISGSISKSGSVNTGALGDYEIIYNVTDASGNSDSDTLKVTVADLSGPVITIPGSNPLVVAEGGTYTEPTVTASDNVDGNVTASIVKSGDTVDPNTPGTYNVIYTVSDAAGNTSIDTLVVNVSDDSQAPVITIPGSNPLSVDSGTGFTEPTVTATDDVDGDVTASIVKSGDTVDTNTVGSYEIIYTVTDVAGNVAKDTLVVNVVSVGAGTTVYNQAIPPAADWTPFGSAAWTTVSVSNESSALKFSNGAYDRDSHRVISKNGNTFTITSGNTYRVTFDIKNTGNSFGTFSVGFANTNASDYNTVSFSGSNATGFSNSATYTSISVDVIATASGTYCIGFDIVQSANTLATEVFIQNLKVVEQ